MLLLLLLIPLQINLAVAYWTYQYLNVSQWQWQSSVIVSDWLYIDGGQLYADSNGVPKQYFLGQTISINLSQSWSNLTVTDHAFETQRAQEGHWTNRPALWHDPHTNQVFQWGGWPLVTSDPSMFWAFTPGNAGAVNWTQQETPVTNEVDQSSPALANSAFVITDRALFSLGGNLAETYTDPYIALPGFLEHDFGTETWTNFSSSAATDGGFLVGGGGAFVPDYGTAGFLVFMGGASPSSQVFHDDGTQLVDMSEITLYDIANHRWYHQTATGEIPSPREYFCIVGSSSAEGTFEIFILGGSTNSTFDFANPEDPNYTNVFALSLPSFTWFQSTDSSQVRRAEQGCQVIGNRQMLVIGGSFPSDKSGKAANDPWPNGLGVFDMTSFAWSNEFDAAAKEYQQPDVVSSYYASSYTTPAWSDSTLAQIFAYTTPTASSGSTDATSGSGAPTGTSNSTTHISPAKSSNIGPIVGGVVGGIGGLLLVAIIAFFVLRQRRRRSAQVPPMPEPIFQPVEAKSYPEVSPFTTPELQGSPEYGQGAVFRLWNPAGLELSGVPRRKPLPAELPS